MKGLNEKELEKAREEYSENKLFNKIVKFASKAGKQVIYYVLMLYTVLQSKKVGAKEKAVIIGALGYFISPIDLIPDVIPVAGYSDDLAALIFALMHVHGCIDEDILEKASSKLRAWFDVTDGEIKEFNKKFQ